MRFNRIRFFISCPVLLNRTGVAQKSILLMLDVELIFYTIFSLITFSKLQGLNYISIFLHNRSTKSLTFLLPFTSLIHIGQWAQIRSFVTQDGQNKYLMLLVAVAGSFANFFSKKSLMQRPIKFPNLFN